MILNGNPFQMMLDATIQRDMPYHSISQVDCR